MSKYCCDHDCQQGISCPLQQHNSDNSDQGIKSKRDYTHVIDFFGAVLLVIFVGFASAYIPKIWDFVKDLI